MSQPDKKKTGTAEKTKFYNNDRPLPEKLEEYNHIEELVMKYKKQFEEDCTEATKREADAASTELLERFIPLFKKYIKNIKNSKIDFKNPEVRRFVTCFLGDEHLKAALHKKDISNTVKAEITQRFNFVTETYGRLDEEEIMIDLQMLLLVLAKRYKQMGFNFCAYVYHTYSYEVVRHIMKYIKNPGNIAYKANDYEEWAKNHENDIIDFGFEDRIYENEMGMPDSSWIAGLTCSEEFLCLTPFQRKLLVKYYIQEYNDRMIADDMDSHINTVNQKRRQSCEQLAEAFGIDPSKIKRNRKSGLKAIFTHR